MGNGYSSFYGFKYIQSFIVFYLLDCVTSLVTSLLRKLKQQSREALESRRPALIQALKELGDFYLELKWDFHSWGKYQV